VNNPVIGDKMLTENIVPENKSKKPTVVQYFPAAAIAF
jgi:hypothetical protein